MWTCLNPKTKHFSNIKNMFEVSDNDKNKLQ